MLIKDLADVKYHFEDTVVVGTLYDIGTLYYRTGLQLLELAKCMHGVHSGNCRASYFAMVHARLGM